MTTTGIIGAGHIGTALARRSLDESTTTSEIVQRHLTGARVVKAFNHIYAADLAERGTPAGTAHRRALAIAGDDASAKATVSSFIDELGLDVVDLGPLAENWRVRRDTPGYGPGLDADQLRAAAAEARRYRDMGCRPPGTAGSPRPAALVPFGIGAGRGTPTSARRSPPARAARMRRIGRGFPRAAARHRGAAPIPRLRRPSDRAVQEWVIAVGVAPPPTTSVPKEDR